MGQGKSFEGTPLVSVAMTTYNGEKFLREQIDSILNQTYQNLEIVICDDCFTDGTFGILEEYERRDSRIKLRRNERNLGFIKNFEQAVSLCTGEFIALSDQDDIWEPWKLEESVKNIEGYDLLCTNSLLVDEERRVIAMFSQANIERNRDDIIKYGKIIPDSEKTLKIRLKLFLVRFPLVFKLVFERKWLKRG